MKKNAFLRTAVILLLIFTLTVSIFMGSGTSAKYVAAAVGEATARVAKFSIQYTAKASANIGAGSSGVVGGGAVGAGNAYIGEIAADPGKVTKLDVGGTAVGVLPLFAANYAKHDVLYTKGANTVEAKENETAGVPNGTFDNLVAPGTMDNGSFTLKLWNASEVAVQLSISIEDLVTGGALGSADWTSLSTLTALKKIPIQFCKDPPTVADRVWMDFADYNDAIAADPIYLPPNMAGTNAAGTSGTKGVDWIEVPLYWRWVFDADTNGLTGTAAGAPADDANRNKESGSASSFTPLAGVGDLVYKAGRTTKGNVFGTINTVDWYGASTGQVGLFTKGSLILPNPPGPDTREVSGQDIYDTNLGILARKGELNNISLKLTFNVVQVD